MGFSLIQNHPFVDGNKRIGHAAMEVVMVLNGFQLVVDVDEEERLVLFIAEGAVDRSAFSQWLVEHQVPV